MITFSQLGHSFFKRKIELCWITIEIARREDSTKL